MARMGRKSKIAVSPLSYNLGLIGEGGIGKSSTIAEYCKLLAGEDGFMFLNMGHEDGLSGMDGIYHVNCIDWNSDYDEETNEVGFATIIDEICENRTSPDYKELKCVVIDTIDELYSLASKEVIRMHNKENPGKKVKSVKAAFGGYMAGDDKMDEIVIDKLWSLKRVNVSFIIIGHTKLRNKIDQSTGEEYAQLTTNLSQRHFDAIKNKLDVLGIAHIDRTIIREKANKKAKATGDDGKRGVVTGESRVITFRDDDYSIDSKSRLEYIAHSCPLDAQCLVDVMNDAIKKKIEAGGGSVAKSEKEQKAEEKTRMANLAKAEAEANEKKQVNVAVERVIEWIVENKANVDAIKPVMAKVKELGYSNPKEISNLKDVEAIIELIS